jgi:uncharacterized membrane protein YhiD involved in acid resistance
MNDVNYLLDKLFQTGPESMFTVTDVFAAMILTATLCVFISYTYRATHRGTSYSQNFIITMFLMAIATSVVMLIIGSNVARAFSLVGALSIIRFRTAVKDPRDTAFLFLAIIAGMGAGTGFYFPVIVMTGFLCVLALGFDRFNFGRNANLESVLKVTYADTTANDKEVSERIKDLFQDSKLINRINDFNSKSVTNIYVVKPKKNATIEQIEKDISIVSGVSTVSLYNSDQHAPF